MTMRASALDAFGSRLRICWHRHVFPRTRGPRPRCSGTLHREHMDGSLPTRNQILNWLKRMKKDRAETSQAEPDHVATAKHTTLSRNGCRIL